MVPRKGLVPHFKRLSDFILMKKLYLRAFKFLPGPERSDTELRLHRHHTRLFRDRHKVHIR